MKLRLVCVLLFAGCGRSMLYDDEPAPMPKTEVQPLCGAVEGTPQIKLGAGNAPGTQVHWTRGECLSVTYDVRLQSSLPVIEDALKQWSAPTCTWVCFKTPVAVTKELTTPADRSIHFRLPQAGDPQNLTVMSSLSFNKTSGAVLFGEIVSQPGKLTTVELLHALGQLLGFASTTLQSVLSPFTSRTTLSDADVQSVCAVYPACRDGSKGR